MSRPPALPCSRSRRERAQETSRNKERNSQWRRAAAGPPVAKQNNKQTPSLPNRWWRWADSRPHSSPSVSWICTRTSSARRDGRARLQLLYSPLPPAAIYAARVAPSQTCVCDWSGGRQAGGQAIDVVVAPVTCAVTNTNRRGDDRTGRPDDMQPLARIASPIW